MMTEPRLINFVAPRKLIERLDAEGIRTGNPRSATIRLAVMEYLERHEKKV